MSTKRSDLTGFSRRVFLRNLALGLGGASAYYFCGIPEAIGKDIDTLSSLAKTSIGKQKGKLGVALVGLGSYSTHQLAPALQETKNCYLAGIVTGTPAKAETWKEKYNIPDKNIYSYDNFDTIKNNPDIDIVYVVLPNSMHAEFTIRAAEAGKHVICEKPMATTVKDAEQMVEACKKADRLLAVGYRLYYEPHNLHMMKLGREQTFGRINTLEAAHSFVIGNDRSAWRLDKELAGGGPLMDLGVYCTQGALYTIGENPTTMTAQFGEVTKPHLFDAVEQSISWQMEFPSKAIAKCTASYADRGNILRAEAEKGWFEVQPAYYYGGIQGKTSEGKMDFPQVNQQAMQMDDFALSVINKQKSIVSGEMGLRDVKLLIATYEAAKTGEKIKLKL